MKPNLLRSCLWVSLTISAAAEIDPLRYEKEVVVPACADPMQMDFDGSGRLFFVERAGAVRRWSPVTKQTVTLGWFPALTTGDAGALGLALAPDFAVTGHLYLFRIPQAEPGKLVLSRHTLQGDHLAGEVRVLEIPLGRGPVQSHCGGGLAWDAAGNLLIGVGDNMPPQDLPAVHPEDTSRDARGTAANSMEWRGKILRITPQPDGTWRIPAGNLFTGTDQGRPEIFAMGVRNPFRLAVDPVTGLVAWGDVGANVRTQLNLGPEGFDEINLTRTAGFFGWPFCSGPNAPWRPFDPKTQAPAGDSYDPLHLVNDSRVNTGIRVLPAARPAAFYYSSTASAEWPFAGSGGRSVTGGVFYRPGPGAGENRLPDELKGHYLFGDWMRNWVASAAVDDGGGLRSAGLLAPGLRFRRPADFKVGPEGALYVAECGDLWSGNTESEITRVVYRRGNRAPQARMTVHPAAGALPLRVSLRGAESRDPDSGDTLKYTWDLGDGRRMEGREADAVFSKEGVWPVTLTVTDAAGLSSTAEVSVMAGNAAPVVTFTAPPDGGFFEWGKPLDWAVRAADAEDGAVPPERAMIQMERRNRAVADDAAAVPPGLALMRKTTCFACHNATEKSAGPPYAAVAAKYAGDDRAPAVLAEKIVSGGVGVWGDLPMPPHPQHTVEEAAQMVSWVLSLSRRQVTTLPPGLSGVLELKAPARQWGQADNGLIALTASATDRGGVSVPPLRGTAEITLRTRRQRAAFFDRGDHAAVQDNLDQGGLVARMTPGGWIAFDRIRLSQTGGVTLHAWPQGAGDLTVKVHAGSSDGPVLAALTVPGGPAGGKPQELALRWAGPPAERDPEAVVLAVSGGAEALMDVMWVDFMPPAK